MKKILNYFIIILLFVFLACEKEIENSIIEYQLSSVGQQGFYYQDLSIIEVTDSTGIVPDFMVFPQFNDAGLLSGSFLANLYGEHRFILLKQFKSLQSAKKYYKTCRLINSLNYNYVAADIQAFQVWQIRIGDNTFGKLLILENTFTEVDNHAESSIRFLAEKLN